MHFTGWPALRVLLHHLCWPDAVKQDPAASSYLGLMLGWLLMVGGEAAGYRNKVGDRGHPTLLIETPRRNSEGEFLLEEPDPARPFVMPHKNSYGLKSTCSQSSGGAAPFLLKSFHQVRHEICLPASIPRWGWPS